MLKDCKIEGGLQNLQCYIISSIVHDEIQPGIDKYM